jgi:hypothetical protein
MRRQRGMTDTLTVLAIATLAFCVLGITAGVFQFLAYRETPQVAPWQAPPEPRVPLVEDSGTAGPDTDTPVVPPPDGDEPQPIPSPPDGEEAPGPIPGPEF